MRAVWEPFRKEKMRVKEWLAKITYELQWAVEKGLRSG